MHTRHTSVKAIFEHCAFYCRTIGTFLGVLCLQSIQVSMKYLNIVFLLYNNWNFPGNNVHTTHTSVKAIFEHCVFIVEQ